MRAASHASKVAKGLLYNLFDGEPVASAEDGDDASPAAAVVTEAA